MPIERTILPRATGELTNIKFLETIATLLVWLLLADQLHWIFTSPTSGTNQTTAAQLSCPVYSAWLAVKEVTPTGLPMTKKDSGGTVAYLSVLMALIPRWQYMSEKSKAIVKSVAGSAAVLLIGLLLLRAFFGWIVLAVIIWAGWKVLNRK